MLQPNVEATALPAEAERLARLGWHLFPALSRSRALPFKGANVQATTDLDTLEQWARDYPGCNWRVNLGKSELWALDVDVPSASHKQDGATSLKRLLQDPKHTLPRDGEGRLHLTMTRSGGGGWALIFRHQGEKLRGDPHPHHKGLDPLRGGQSITVPPSIHVDTRKPYRWLKAPWDTPPEPAPAWLLDLYAAPKEDPVPERPQREPSDEVAEMYLFKSVDSILTAADGNRNNTLVRRAYRLGIYIGAGLISEGYVRNTLYSAARQAGLEPRESLGTIDGALRRGSQKPLVRR